MTTDTDVQSFLGHLAARDYDRVATTLAPDAVARLLLPLRIDQANGAEAIARLFEGWFGASETFTVRSIGARPIGRKWLLHWRFEVCRDGATEEVIEQVAFAEVGPAGIHKLDLACSGFLATAAPVDQAAAATH
jgi:hypothetical protein